MDHIKENLQRKTAAPSDEMGAESDIQRSQTPPTQLFADPNAGNGGSPGQGIVQAKDEGEDSGSVTEGDSSVWGISFADIIKGFQSYFGTPAAGTETPAAETAAPGAQTAAPVSAAASPAAPTPTTDPPNKLVPVNDRDTHKISDAIVGDLSAVVADVQTYTGIDIGTGFGDTTRGIGEGTKKEGADNFSWHKSGRAVDFNQNLAWVIAKDPTGETMYFRIYLQANDAGAASEYAKTFTKEEVPNLHHNGMGANVTKKPVVDVTAILGAHGFERIPAHTGWEKSYNKREWWHYVKDDGLTWYQALSQLYTDAQIVEAMKKLVVSRHSNGGRLGRREGFPPDTLKAIWDNTPVTMGKLSLYFSVGADKNCANIPEDVLAVKTALIGLGIAESPDVATMISAYQLKKGNKSPDGYITVGGTTHGTIGGEMK